MTSDPVTVFVWVWLPEETDPIICGRLDWTGNAAQFVYGRSYLNRSNPMPLYGPELPIRSGPHHAADTASGVPLVVADALPDAWARRVIHHRDATIGTEYSDLHYLLAGGSDRIGALGFTLTADDPPAPPPAPVSLDDLADAAARIEAGEDIPAELVPALQHGTSIGGARPKAFLVDGGRRLIAKFASSTDPFPVVQGEFVAMELAHRAGIATAPVELFEGTGRTCLLVERFDRTLRGGRRHLVSALTTMGLAAFPSGRYATYTALADRIRQSFTDPDAALRELFTRIAFNMMVGNTDDHGKNHAAFVHPNGITLTLTPAYDICPQIRTGGEAALAMAYGPDGERRAQVAPLIDAAGIYHLDSAEAAGMVEHLETTIRDEWDDVCDRAHLTPVQRRAFWGSQFLNPFTFGW